MVEFELTEEMLDQYGIDIDVLMDILDQNNIEYYIDPDTGTWTFKAEDEDDDGIPDILADLFSDPITTNPSQGGALG